MHTIEKTIEDDFGKDHEYSLTRHGFMEGKDIARKLSSIVQKGLKGDASGASIDIGGMIESVADNLNDDMIVSLMKYTLRDNQKLTKTAIDSMYQGNYGEFLSAMRFIIEANFMPAIERVMAGKL